MKFILGTDIGGTFTDTVIMNDAGEISIFKQPSTPRDYSEGVIHSIELANETLGLGVEEFLSKVETFFHGTTVGMNAVLTRKGSKVGFITTRGFGDTLPMMRASRTISQDALKMSKPSLEDETTLIPIYMIEEVSERVDSSGDVLVPLDMTDVARAVKSLVEKGAEAIAVCLLWSIRNPLHELSIKQYIHEQYPGLFVSISSEVMPVIREYERSVVTLINSYVANIIEKYLNTLESRLRSKGLQSPFLVMQSTGGAISANEAVEKPCHLFLSGPAGGVMGSLFLGDILGYTNILTFDMGGTSTDVSAVMNGHPTMVNRSKLAEFDATLPKLDIHTIGAGGGSIGWIDHGVLLRVGPQSAGAEPGPACYDRGGKEPTVTDANVVLGYIEPEHFLDGRMPIRPDLAEEAVAQLGARLGLSLIETAVGIVEIANSNMVNALRAVTVEKGHDPRDFVMMCFGGAGPLHASALIDELGMPMAIIPYTATVHSAFGFVCSNICHHLVTSHYIRNPESAAPFNDVFSDLEEQGTHLLIKEGVTEKDRVFKRFADLKYSGQVFEITVDIPERLLTDQDISDIKARFEETYDSLYGKGTGWKEAGIDVVNFRIDAIGQMPKPSLKRFEIPDKSGAAVERRKRPCYFNEAGGFVSTPFYDIGGLSPGMNIEGPAVIIMPSTSAVIGPRQGAYVDEYRNVIIREKGGANGQR